MQHLLGYYPKSFALVSGKAFVLMAPLSDEQLNSPFINCLTRRISNKNCQLIELDTQAHKIKQMPQAKITAFIFHHGRCGSTLLAKMLCQKASSRVIFESQTFVELLSCNTSDDNKTRWLTLLLQLFAHSTLQTHVFIKFSSICLHSIALIQASCPDVKTIGLYRNPIESVVALTESKKKFPPAGQYDQLIMAAHLAVAPHDITAMSREEFIAKNLAAMLCRITRLKAQPQARLVNYNTMPNSIINDIAPWLDFGLTEDDKQMMRQVCVYYSKSTTNSVFKSDSEDKINRMTAAISQYIDIPQQVYRQLG